MVEFETIKSEELKFGKNNFFEISRSRVMGEYGKSEFLSIRKGYYNKEDEKRYKQTLTMPNDENLLDDIVYRLKNVMG